MSPRIFIVGQTASGKTGLSLDIAQEHSYEILNTDSLLFYKGLDIGTAKPSREEQALVPHHLIDICEAGEELSAADYEEKAEKVLQKNREQKFLCVGGSGFYIKALDVGLLPLPESCPEIKEKVLALSDPVSELKKHDPLLLSKISEKDLYRVHRALQVFYQTGKPLSEWQKEFKSQKTSACKVALDWDREELRKRVELRTQRMLKEGLLEELQKVRKKTSDLEPGLASQWKPLYSVGYKEAGEYLDGVIKSKAELVESIVTKTMQLSKRQKTWFKKDSTVRWFPSKDLDKAKAFIVQALEEEKWKA